MNIKSFEKLLGLTAGARPFVALKIVQRLVFMHPAKGKSFTRFLMAQHFTVVFIINLPIIFGVHAHIYQAFSDGLIQEAVGSLYYSSSIVSYMLIGIVYNLYGNRLWQVIERIVSNKFQRPQALVEECRNSNLMVVVSSFSVLILEGTLSIYYYMTNMYCESRVKTNNKKYRCGYDSAVWYPFEEDTVVKEWVLKLWWNVGELIILPVVVPTIFSFMEMLRFISIRMEHLRSLVNAIDETNIQNSSGQIKFIAKYYIEILECIKELNSSLGYPFVFAYTCSIVVLSLTGYVVFLVGTHSSRTEKPYIYLLFVLGGKVYRITGLLIIYVAVMILCYFGQIWENEHQKLVASVTNLPWYLMTPKMRRDYMFLLGTIQIPVHLIAQPNVFINNSLFLAVTRTTYSVLAFLKQSTN